jgi:putative SOS response-associated peptidase YedK
MCGRYTLTMPIDSMRELFGFDARPNLAARYNVAPGQDIPAVRINDAGTGRQLAGFNWGLLPSWVKDPVTANRMINTRGETVAEKPSFRAAFQRRRCLIPANGFYEWKLTGKSIKQPYYIQLKGGAPIAFAGIWERWEGGNGDHWETCAVVTTEATEALMHIHHRMPVILPPNGQETWLTGDMKEVSKLMVPYSGLTEAWPVTTLVNRVQNDSSKLVEQAEPLATPAPPIQSQLDLF